MISMLTSLLRVRWLCGSSSQYYSILAHPGASCGERVLSTFPKTAKIPKFPLQKGRAEVAALTTGRDAVNDQIVLWLHPAAGWLGSEEWCAGTLLRLVHLSRNENAKEALEAVVVIKIEKKKTLILLRLEVPRSRILLMVLPCPYR